MKLFLSAGEPSGDVHGSNLIRAIRARRPDAQITAFGGPLMRAAGAEIVYP
ncbi:MAG: lipid-A-disaccharide synthetase, partial [Planctomycetes bacterium]|nr:lipid-A-disaccharide synthetase [Planctomycetota bacterium]